MSNSSVFKSRLKVLRNSAYLYSFVTTNYRQSEGTLKPKAFADTASATRGTDLSDDHVISNLLTSQSHNEDA